MMPIARLAAVAYAVTIFLGGYLAVSTIKGLWTAAGHFEQLAVASTYGEDNLDRTMLVFDEIEPAGGEASN